MQDVNERLCTNWSRAKLCYLALHDVATSWCCSLSNDAKQLGGSYQSGPSLRGLADSDTSHVSLI
jgi:hypothetical protein